MSAREREIRLSKSTQFYSHSQGHPTDPTAWALYWNPSKVGSIGTTAACPEYGSICTSGASSRPTVHVLPVDVQWLLRLLSTMRWHSWTSLLLAQNTNTMISCANYNACMVFEYPVAVLCNLTKAVDKSPYHWDTRQVHYLGGSTTVNSCRKAVALFRKRRICRSTPFSKGGRMFTGVRVVLP